MISVTGKVAPYPARNLDPIAEVDPQSSPPPGKYYEYTQKMNSAPVSPAKKVRPGSAGAGGLRPRLTNIEQWNPLGGGAGVKDREELNRDKNKRTLISGIVEAQGGSKELHGRTFRGIEKGVPQKREDSFVNSLNGNSTSNKNFGETVPDVTHVSETVHLEDDPLSPAWGRSRSHSTGTGTTSHVNDSSVSTGSSGFFSRLLATPSKHLRKRYGENEDGTALYRKDRDRGDEESVGSRNGGSLENTLGYEQYQCVRDENVQEEIEVIKSKLCLRVSVKSSSRYRLCDSNPQEEGDCTWACATGIFQQSFILRGDNCDLEDRLVASDRLVTVIMDARIHTREGDIHTDNIPGNSNCAEHSEEDSVQDVEKVKKEVKIY